MRKILLSLAAPALAIGFLAAAPAAAAPADNHGQCASSSAKPTGKGGRSAVARDKEACTPPPPLTCVTNGTATRDSAADTVTVTGTGPGTPGSSLECATSIAVTGGSSTITFDYAITGDPCGGGVPRIFVVVDGAYYNTIDGDPVCSQQQGSTITYTIPVSGTVTTVGLVYDRGDTGSVTYSNAAVGGVVLDL